MSARTKKTMIVLAAALLIIAGVGAVTLANGGLKGKKDEATYTIYAIGADSNTYALSSSVLEDVEENGVWFGLNEEQNRLIHGIDDISAFIKGQGLSSDQLRIVLVNDAFSSSVWQANATNKGLDVASYENSVKTGILKELGF